ncbi:hypothetical protein GOZ96_09195 [Agrobacterium vitis]|uniref:Bacterial OB-fold domain-containing protein n=1 Tax=Agrobacterium vitis TaxID=373 RepID=A0A368P2S9_AGRVI|nr:hypothetical protein [Agrobacterium vitis]KAA3510794.1 hypothetical protein DXM22_18555 [Agrobacterium vitis]KAA3528055.1 hypothetical protein DXT89_12475 [Agrobacterium vitis]MCF1478614.1 hypothetical protein [Agrobacterium vitis]MUZ96775.1 hypothetical protein [Agrobacterium vitis]MVA28372.1 hypothetical protein [Agrobacterium vitis]
MMTVEHPSDEHPEKAGKPSPPHERRKRYWMALPAIAVALAIGAVGGAGAMKLVRPAPEMAPISPVAISMMPTSSLVTIKGKVSEIYGNKFILQDDSGKALVETGPAGDGGGLVTKDDVVTIQGRFDDGVVHASYLVDSSGKTAALGPPGPPPHRPFGDFANRPAP